VSVNPVPVRIAVALLFWIVKVRLVEPLSGMVAAPNALLIRGGATTVTLALEVFPRPPLVEPTWTLLFFAPDVVPVTLSEITQEALAASAPADSVVEDVPAAAVDVPPQELARLFGVATTTPAGNVSVNATPVSATLEFGFVMLKVSEVVPPVATVLAPNDLVIAGATATAKLAEAVLPVPPLDDVTFPETFVN